LLFPRLACKTRTQSRRPNGNRRGQRSHEFSSIHFLSPWVLFALSGTKPHAILMSADLCIEHDTYSVSCIEETPIALDEIVPRTA